MPSLVELDRFTEANLRQWTSAAAGLQSLYAALYFELEPRRQKDAQRLLDAIRLGAIQDFEFENWSRVVDYQYSTTPLSTAGSVRGVGGRFNFGEEISRGTLTSFPALYAAEDADTAFRERFGSAANPGAGGLTGAELALRTESSFTHLRLRGSLDLAIDVSDVSSLRPFVEIIREYAMPKTARTVSRNLAMRRPPSMIRSPSMLQRHLLHPDWRAWPMQFSVPANSQIFGRFASAAGLHGIVYPSSKNSTKKCIALFPTNWKGSSSYVELADVAPPEVESTRLDGGKFTTN